MWLWVTVSFIGWKAIFMMQDPIIGRIDWNHWLWCLECRNGRHGPKMLWKWYIYIPQTDSDVIRPRAKCLRKYVLFCLLYPEGNLNNLDTKSWWEWSMWSTWIDYASILSKEKCRRKDVLFLADEGVHAAPNLTIGLTLKLTQLAHPKPFGLFHTLAQSFA